MTEKNISKGDRLKIIREVLSMSQVEMSKKLGIRQSYYSNMESGKKNISSNVVNKLFDEFSISPSWFYNGENEGQIFNVAKTSKRALSPHSQISPPISPLDIHEGVNERKGNMILNKDDKMQGTNAEKMQEKIQNKINETTEHWQEQNNISNNDLQVLSENYIWSNWLDNKKINVLYMQTTRELSNKIALLKHEYRSIYKTYYSLLEAINKFKLGRYKERFELPVSWEENIAQFEKDMNDEYSELEDKKLISILYIQEYENEIERLRSNIDIIINKFNDISGYISRIQSSLQMENNESD